MKTFLLLFACQVLLTSQVTSEMFNFEKLLKSLDTKKSSHQSERPVPRQLLDEFSTYVDRLMSSEETANRDQSDITREMRNDYDELLEAMANDVSDVGKRRYKLKPGQVPPLECGEFGCCPDNSPAPPTGKEGCALRLCADVHMGTCNYLLETGKLDCAKMWRKCPFSCKRCKTPAAPMRQCELDNPGAFCCWDGQRGTGSDGKRCRPCADHYTRVCGIFKGVSRGCNSNSWRIRNFMQTHCPSTCGICAM